MQLKTVGASINAVISHTEQFKIKDIEIICNVSQVFANAIGDNPEKMHYFKVFADKLTK